MAKVDPSVTYTLMRTFSGNVILATSQAQSAAITLRSDEEEGAGELVDRLNAEQTPVEDFLRQYFNL